VHHALAIIAVRRLRAPLIFLLVVFAVSTAGLTLIPGRDAAGVPWHPTLFEAFYFVTYTATTIGFGELRHEFNDIQRLWVTVIIYLSVIGWAYLLGSLLALAQDKGFQASLVISRFDRSVKRLREPFYLVCGLGETGLMVARALDQMDRHFIAVDADERRVVELELGDYGTDPSALAADATSPEVLRMAGLLKPECRGVVALTHDDDSNLAIAVAARLLRPGLRVICRAHDPSVMASMRTVGVEEIINPYREFADRLAVAMRAPDAHRLLSWLTGPYDAYLPPRIPAPPGRWVVCGYGRFGTEVVRAIRAVGIEVSVVDPKTIEEDGLHAIAGSGDDADVLEEAGITKAVGLVAGTDNDTANLAVAIAGRLLNPDLFLILRRNLVSNASLFAACGANMVMKPSELIADECLATLRTRHLSAFLAQVRRRDNDWAASVTERLLPIVGDTTPHFWTFALTEAEAPGLLGLMARSARPILIGEILRDIVDRTPLACVPLMLVRGAEHVEIPEADHALRPGDEILFAGKTEARRQLSRTLGNANTAGYVVTGRDDAISLIGRLLRRD
jgi:Trk K+ transport system NAD-binding subunit